VRFVSPISIFVRSALLAALTTAAAAATATTLCPMAAEAAGAALPPKCTTASLVIWLDTRANATLGHVDYNLQMTNLSGHACVLRGYPRVSAVDVRGRQLGAAARSAATRPVRSVRLGRGVTARAVLRITDVGIFRRSRCRHTAAAGLQVRLPSARSSQRVPFPFTACSRRSVRYLTIQAVRPE
jgi:curli biogenesis system outer membrane secretion channel CsgG